MQILTRPTNRLDRATQVRQNLNDQRHVIILQLQQFMIRDSIREPLFEELGPLSSPRLAPQRTSPVTHHQRHHYNDNAAANGHFLALLVAVRRL